MQRLALVRWFRLGVEMIASRAVTSVLSGLSAIWISRCLGPENLGISGTVLNLACQAQVLVLLNQDAGLLRSYKRLESDTARSNLISGVITFRLIMLLVIAMSAAVVLLIASPEPKWTSALIFFFPLLLPLGFPSLWIYAAQDRQNIDIRFSALLALINFGGVVLFLRPGSRAEENLAVLAFAQIATVAFSWRYAIKGLPRPRLSSKLMYEYLPVLWQGRWLAITGIFSAACVYAQTPMIAALNSKSDAGLYRSAEQVVGAITPFFMIAFNFLYPRFIAWAQEGQGYLWRRQLRLLQIIGLLSLPVVLLGGLGAPPFFRTVLGSEFEGASLPFTILLVGKCINMLSGVFTWALYAQHRDRAMLMITASISSLSLTLNLCVIPQYSTVGAAVVALIGEIVLFSVAGLYCFNISRPRARPSDT